MSSIGRPTSPSIMEHVAAHVRADQNAQVFRAAVTALVGDQVTVSRFNETSTDTYPKLASYVAPQVGDEVLVVRLGRGFIVMGRVLRATPLTAIPVVYESGAVLTIAAGVVTVTASHHRVDTEGGAGSDNLDTMNGAVANGHMLVIQPEDSVRTIVVTHGVGNILLDGQVNYTMDNANDTLHVRWDGTNWTEIGRGDNGA